MNLLSMLMGTLGSDNSVDALAKKTGLSSANLSKLLMAAVPLLLKFMTKNASSAGGAQSLLGALGGHKETRSMADQIADADEEDGSKIVRHILGDESDAVVNSLAKDTDLGTADVQKAQLQDMLRKCHILTPIKGIILEKYVEQGEFVSVGKPLFKIADTESMRLRAYVTSAQLQNLKIGQKVKVFANYGDGQRKEYAGTISWISSRSEFTPKTILTDDERADLVYAVKVAIKNDGFVKIGMYGEVKLINN